VRKRRAAGIAAMVSTFYAVGCSLLVDTEGLGGSPTPDASGDATGDRTAQAESGADTSAPIDAGKTCEATFCDDFDEGGIGARWTSKDIQNGGLLDLGTPAVSAPNALRTRFATSTAMTDRVALLERDLGMGTHLRCDFSMFLETRPSTSFVDLFRIRTTAPGVNEYNLFFGVNASTGATFREDLYLTDGGCGCPRKEANPPTLLASRWVRVSVETDFATASLAYDGVVVSAGSFGGFAPGSNIFVALGTVAYQQQPSVVLFDDFSCTLGP